MPPSTLPTLVGLDPSDRDRTDRLVDVVRAALGDETAGTIAPLDGPFVRWALIHGVRAELAVVADRFGADDEAAAVLDRALHRDQLRALTASAMSRRIVTRLSAAGIDVLVLKGVALSVQRGGAATDRPGTDLDLLIRPQDRVAAHRVLTDSGFSVHSTVPEPGDDTRTRYLGFATYETVYVSKVIHLDLHWRLGPVHLPTLDAGSLIVRSVQVDLGSTIVPTLHPDDTLAHVVLHGAKDHWVTMRSVIDLALLIDRAGASWDRAIERIPRSHAPGCARAALEFLTDGRLPGGSVGPATTDDLHVWVRGVVERPHPDEDHRPAEGFVGFVRHRAGLARSTRSTVAVVAHLLLPSTAIARSRLPRRWWWLTAFVRPFRIGSQLGRIATRRWN